MLSSTAMAGEKSMTFMMLPSDLIFNCLARVSRLYYPALSLVSKGFRSLLLSLELYETRSFLGCTENFLYVCLQQQSYGLYRTRWFTLCWKPTQITNPNFNPSRLWLTPPFTPNRLPTIQTRKKEEKKLSNLKLSLVSTVPHAFIIGRVVVALGCNIYEIGGYLLSSRVLFMDCRSHTWHKAPSMRMERKYPHVTVFDGKIYVVGGIHIENCDSSNWIEFFDPETQKWEYLPCPGAEVFKKGRIYGSLAIEGKLCLFGANKSFVTYKPKENRWDDVGIRDMGLDWQINPSHFCVINNVLYKIGFWRKLEWYDFEGRCWRVLTGLEKLPNLPKGDNYVTLTSYGRKLAVLWKGTDGKENEIWCAEIAVERRNGRHEIHGKVEWCDVVLTLPEIWDLLNFLPVSL